MRSNFRMSENFMIYKFGIICPPFTGHLNPMTSLALELIRKKHKVVLFYYNTNKNIFDLGKLGIETIYLGNEFTESLINNNLARLSKLTGWKANKQAFRIYKELVRINLQFLPEKIKSVDCDALLIDQSMVEGESIAAVAKLPFITICSALILNPDLSVPPPFLEWQPNLSFSGQIRNFIGYLFVGLNLSVSFKKATKLISDYRKCNYLPKYPAKYKKEYSQNLWSSIATVSQQPSKFEFPRSDLDKKKFHFTAPFINHQIREDIDFPWEKLDGKPLIYASIGTLQNSVDNLYSKIACACLGINCQLVMALGEPNKKLHIDKLPQNAIIMSYAPQLQLLQRASLCITHAGINTVLEALFYGVPMVAMPIANDQPGIAARVKYTGTGMIVNRKCNILQLNRAIEKVLNTNFYRENALKMQNDIRKHNGSVCAANIIEKVIDSCYISE